MKLSTLEQIFTALNTAGVRFVTIPTLIKMKQLANREQDRIDIEHLRMRLEDHGGK